MHRTSSRRSRPILVLLKLLNLFISSFLFFFLACSFFRCCSSSIARSAMLTARPSVHVRFYSLLFRNESFYTGNVFHKVVRFFLCCWFLRRFFRSFFLSRLLCICRVSARPRYYCLQCNFRLFAVRLYCFIFRINSHWRLFHLQQFFFSLVWFGLLLFLPGISSSFFTLFPHSFNQMPTLPSLYVSTNSFCWTVKKDMVCACVFLFFVVVAVVSFVSLLISTLHDWWVLYSQHSCHSPFFDVRFQHIHI